MFLYQLTLVVTEKKFDEFIESLRVLSSGIREEQGCLDSSFYRDLEKKDAYRVRIVISNKVLDRLKQEGFKGKVLQASLTVGAEDELRKASKDNFNAGKS